MKVMDRKDICSYDYRELEDEITGMGEKSFRSRQIYEWLHVKLIGDFAGMTNLSRQLRDRLEGEYKIAGMRVAEHQISKADPTEKFLFELEDGNMIESVPYASPPRRAAAWAAGSVHRRSAGLSGILLCRRC